MAMLTALPTFFPFSVFPAFISWKQLKAEVALYLSKVMSPLDRENNERNLKGHKMSY